MNNIHYLQTVPNSHFWDKIETLINYLEVQKSTIISKDELIEYLQIGLKNSINNGFNIQEKCKDPIVEDVRELLKQRSNVGVKKYGTTLDRSDLSLNEWLNHALEEFMDATLYLNKSLKKMQENQNYLIKTNEKI